MKIFSQRPSEKYNFLGGRPNIIQDDQGFIWFTTQTGLVKYDGYHFQVYRAGEQENELRFQGSNHGLIKGSDGKLWMSGTNKTALTAFDPKTENFQSFVYGPDGDDSLPFNLITPLLEDTRGNLWFVNHKRAPGSSLYNDNRICRLAPQSGNTFYCAH